MTISQCRNCSLENSYQVIEDGDIGSVKNRTIKNVFALLECMKV